MGIGFKRSARALLVGSLVFGGAITASMVTGTPQASAAVVVQTIAVGTYPTAISSDGTHVWVANLGSGTVTELNASDGAVVQNIAVGSFPSAISSDGTHVWAIWSGGVTELNASDGSVVQTIAAGASSGGQGISSDGTHVWVANNGSGGVTELNASDGSIVQTIAAGSVPDAISSDGTQVWTANFGSGTVTELNASDGSVVQTIAVGTGPNGISSDGTHVWVANQLDSSVSELALQFAIATTSLPAAIRGTVYGPVTLTAADVGVSTRPYATTLKWGKIWSLPKGLRLSSSGVLSGTPNPRLEPGTTSITVEVTERVTALYGKKKKMNTTTALATIPLTVD